VAKLVRCMQIKQKRKGKFIRYRTTGDKKTVFRQAYHHSEQGNLSHAQLHKERTDNLPYKHRKRKGKILEV
jgi:hypothetical protein